MLGDWVAVEGRGAAATERSEAGIAAVGGTNAWAAPPDAAKSSAGMTNGGPASIRGPDYFPVA